MPWWRTQSLLNEKYKRVGALEAYIEVNLRNKAFLKAHVHIH